VASFLNKASRYGLYALVSMARAPDERLTASAIAQTFDISENHVAKVLQQLARVGLVQSTRGVGGGYQLAEDASSITMLDVVECLDGPFTDSCATCSLRDTERCAEEEATCAVHNVLAELNQTAYYTLKSVTVQTLARDAGAPARMLRRGAGQGPA
jgi:Rrf2 family protein